MAKSKKHHKPRKGALCSHGVNNRYCRLCEVARKKKAEAIRKEAAEKRYERKMRAKAERVEQLKQSRVV